MACSWGKYPSKSGTVLEVFPVSETARWLGKYVSLTQLCSSFRPTHKSTLGCQVYNIKNNNHKANNHIMKTTINPNFLRNLRIHLSCSHEKTMFRQSGWIHLNELKQLICEALVRGAYVSLHG